MPHSDIAGPSATAVTQPDVAGPSTATAIQPDAATPSNAPVAEKVRGIEAGLDIAVAEGAPDKKSSPAPTTPPSWDELMEMLKGVSCFTDVEAPFLKMSDFFSLTKRISIKYGWRSSYLCFSLAPF